MARYYGYYSTSQLQVFLKFLPGDGWAKEREWALKMGLAGADSIEDKSIPTFARAVGCALERRDSGVSPGRPRRIQHNSIRHHADHWTQPHQNYTGLILRGPET
jgi:hypothetical protein